MKRIWKPMLYTILGVLALWAVAMGQTAGVIQARRFILVGEDGNPRAVLSAVEDQTELTLFDSNGKARMILAVTNNGPTINLHGNIIDGLDQNRDGIGVRMRLAVNSLGPLLTLQDDMGKSRLLLMMNDTMQEPRIDTTRRDAVSPFAGERR